MTETNSEFCPSAGCRIAGHNEPMNCRSTESLRSGSIVVIEHLKNNVKSLENEISMCKQHLQYQSVHADSKTHKQMDYELLPSSNEVNVFGEFHGLRAGTLVLVEHLQSKIRTLENELCALRSKEQSAPCQLHEPVTCSVKVSPNSDSNAVALYQSEKDVFADSQMDEYQESPIDSHMDIAVNNSVSDAEISGLKFDSTLNAHLEYKTQVGNLCLTQPGSQANHDKSPLVDSQNDRTIPAFYSPHNNPVKPLGQYKRESPGGEKSHNFNSQTDVKYPPSDSELEGFIFPKLDQECPVDAGVNNETFPALSGGAEYSKNRHVFENQDKLDVKSENIVIPELEDLSQEAPHGGVMSLIEPTAASPASPGGEISFGEFIAANLADSRERSSQETSCVGFKMKHLASAAHAREQSLHGQPFDILDRCYELMVGHMCPLPRSPGN